MGTQDYIAENKKQDVHPPPQSGGGHAERDRRAVICPKPEGAFYVIVHRRVIGQDHKICSPSQMTESSCHALLEDTGVAVVFARGFALSPNFPVSAIYLDEALKEACNAFAEKFCAALSLSRTQRSRHARAICQSILSRRRMRGVFRCGRRKPDSADSRGPDRRCEYFRNGEIKPQATVLLSECDIERIRQWMNARAQVPWRRRRTLTHSPRCGSPHLDHGQVGA